MTEHEGGPTTILIANLLFEAGWQTNQLDIYSISTRFNMKTHILHKMAATHWPTMLCGINLH